MINISKKCLQALQNDAVQRVKIKVEPLRGNSFTLTESDLLLNGFEWENHSVCGEQLEIGSMTAALLKLILDNEDGRFNNIFFAGARLTVELIIPLDDGTDEHISFGVYTVDEQPRAWSTITLNAFDNMIRLDIPFQPDQNAYLIRGLVEEGLEKAGLYCADTSMFPYTAATGMIDATKIKSESPITWRQVLMWCCECVGVCGIADENGHIKFRFYKKYTPDVLQAESEEDLEPDDSQILRIDGALEGDFELPPSVRFINNTELEESDIVVTGFQFKDGDQLYPADAVMDYGLQSEGNLVFSAATPRAKSNFAKLANDAVAGFTYRPYSCDILSFPHLQLLDGVDYIKDGVHHHSIVTNLTFKLNGNMSIAAKAKSAVQKGWASLGALTPGQRVIIDAISQKVDKTQSDLTAREQFLISFNEAITGSMGFYSTIKEQDDGSRVSYMHDKPNLEESQTIYTFGVNGFAWTNDGWNGGNPVWQSGFDKDGNAILNAIYAYKLTADVIVSGYLRSQNGASWINMDNGEFCFQAIKDMWLDIDTGKPTYIYEKVLELAGKELNVYGKLRNLNYPKFSVSVGPSSETESHAAFAVTDSTEGYGNILQISPWRWYNKSDPNTTTDRGVGIMAPFLGTEEGSRQGIQFNSTESILKNEKALGSALLYGANAWVSVFRDNINISTNPSTHSHCWFNYYPPQFGKKPTAYDFGNGNKGHAAIHASKIGIGFYDDINADDICAAFKGGVTIGDISNSSFSYEGATLSVYGVACVNGIDVTSDPNLKKNISEISSMCAVDKISKMKFYSYDYKESDIHADIGVMANEAPIEIQSNDGKAIDLYAYINLTTKAVQELSAKVEQQEKEIAELKAVIAELKQ